MVRRRSVGCCGRRWNALQAMYAVQLAMAAKEEAADSGKLEVPGLPPISPRDTPDATLIAPSLQADSSAPISPQSGPPQTPGFPPPLTPHHLLGDDNTSPAKALAAESQWEVATIMSLIPTHAIANPAPLYPAACMYNVMLGGTPVSPQTMA